MQRLKLAASKIPIELMERLNRLTELTGLTQSAAIRQAIEQYLDNTELTGLTWLTAIEGNLMPSQLVTTDNPVYSRLTEIEARLERLESRSASTTVKPIATTSPNTKTKSKSKKAPTSQPIGGAMTVGELFLELGDKYPHSQVTLSKRLNEARATRQLPDDLNQLGVIASWEIREATSRFNNQCRWLMLEQADRDS